MFLVLAFPDLMIRAGRKHTRSSLEADCPIFDTNRRRIPVTCSLEFEQVPVCCMLFFGLEGCRTQILLGLGLLNYLYKRVKS